MIGSLGKRILKWTILVTPWVLALGLAVGWGLAVWTPGYLEYLVPQLADEMGLPLEEFHIRDAGLFSADIGPVRLGGEEDGIRLENVHATYTPASLKGGRVNEVIIDGVSLKCVYDGESFSVPALDLLPKSEEQSPDTELPDLPFDRLVIKDSILLCDYAGKRFSIPFSGALTPGEALRFSGELHPRDQRVSISGELSPSVDDLSLSLKTDSFQLGALGDIMPIPIDGNLALDLEVDVNLSQPEMLTAKTQLTIRNSDLPGLGVALAGGTSLSAQATIANKTVSFSMAPVSIATPYPATVTGAEGQLSANSLVTQFTAEVAGVTLPCELKADRNDEIWTLALTAANPDKLAVDTGGRTIRLAGIDFDLTGTISPDTADVVVKGTTKGASLDGVDARIGTTKIELPLKWPAPAKHTPGKLRISGLRYDKYKLGTVSAILRQEDMNLAYGGTLFTRLLPDLRVPFSGFASMVSKDATLKFDIDNYLLPADFDPSTLMPDVKGVQVSGTLAVEGGVNISKGDIESRLGLFFTNGTMTLTESGTSISGIRLYFESPDLINFRSAPAQMLAFDTLKAGGIEVQNGVATFQLEPRGVVLVEQLGFDWCDGHVASRAFRVVPGHEEYDITLFCSHLKLSSILGQLGLAEARGAAALSGELPVTWRNGKISFNNGFLHSAPGQGGTVQIDAMEDLVDAIPEGSPQRGQLELAQAAIKDFDYKWVRIKADTVGEDLLVRLSLDGKPASTLPFVYRKEFGGFAKVTGDVKGSNFQGLRLDVNFNIPLDRILLYKDIIDMIE